MGQKRWRLLRFTTESSLALIFALPEIKTAGAFPSVIVVLLHFYQFRARHLHFFRIAAFNDVLESHAALVSKNFHEPALFGIKDPADGSKRFAEIVDVRDLAQLYAPVQAGFIDAADIDRIVGTIHTYDFRLVRWFVQAN